MAHGQRSDAVVFAKMDLTTPAARPIAIRFNTRDYPRLKWFDKGETTRPVEYNSGMEAADLVRFVNRRIRTWH